MKKEGDAAERKANPPADWPERFLEAFRKNGNISQSARLARVTRHGVLARRDADPDFGARMKGAAEEAADALEGEARRRAVTGTLKPVFYKGEEVGKVREYSDTLLIVLLKANNPDKFRENAQVTHAGAIGVIGYEVVAPVMAKPDAE